MDPSPRLSALQSLHRLANSSVESLAWNSKVNMNSLPRKATAPLLDQMQCNGSDRQAGMLSYIRFSLNAASTVKTFRVKEALGYGN